MRSVLVVEDDDAIRECVAEVLASEGFAVFEAQNGKLALQLMEAAHPDIIVLDLMMPVMSGWEFCREKALRSDFAAIPVIVMTATPDTAVEDVQRVIHKPFEIDVLIEAVCGSAAYTPDEKRPS